MVLVELDPAVGAEQGKTRPAVVVSNDGANSAASRHSYGVITVVPLTGNTASVRPFQALIPAAESGLDRDSKAQAEQVRSISVSRVARRYSVLPRKRMASVDEALRVHLSL